MKYLGGDIYQGDCLKVMADLPDQSVDLIICDLPYGTTQNKWDSVIAAYEDHGEELAKALVRKMQKTDECKAQWWTHVAREALARQMELETSSGVP